MDPLVLSTFLTYRGTKHVPHGDLKVVKKNIKKDTKTMLINSKFVTFYFDIILLKLKKSRGYVDLLQECYIPMQYNFMFVVCVIYLWSSR